MGECLSPRQFLHFISGQNCVSRILSLNHGKIGFKSIIADNIHRQLAASVCSDVLDVTRKSLRRAFLEFIFETCARQKANNGKSCSKGFCH